MRTYLVIALYLISKLTFAQQITWNSARILHEIQKLNTTGSVLYIAAHPDDENTRLITWLANEMKVRTGYLSLTRGDGGQNLIGEEQGAYLGVIRTQELLAARNVDGGEQFFTRAVDFGYSKNADETYTKWPHDSLLADVVWVIRNFRPDIIITRFPPDERAGHGQHTVSALLAEEAFDAAADPLQFPEQLQFVTVWQTQRLFWNNALRWDESLPEKIKNGDKNIVTVNVGAYNPLLGKSYGEIAADSRTKHKSQGFGSTPTRGEYIEYLYLKKGTQCTSIFDGILTTWERYRQGSALQAALDKIIADYNILAPEKSVDALLHVFDVLNAMPTDKYIAYKKQQLQNILIACLGLWLEPVAEKDIIANGDTLKVFNNMLVRAHYPVTVKSYTYLTNINASAKKLIAEKNEMDTILIVVPADDVSTPYWLNNTYDGLFYVPEQVMRGKAVNDALLHINYLIAIGDTEFEIKRNVVYKETDAVKGEIYKSVAVVPPVILQAENEVIVLQQDSTYHIKVEVRAMKDYVYGFLRCGRQVNETNGAGGWYLNRYVELSQSGDTYIFDTTVAMNGSQAIQDISFWFIKDIKKREEVTPHASYSNKQMTTIEYDHIPRQTIFEPATVKLVNVDTKIPDKKILYVEGAGDNVKECLEQLGVNITAINPERITAEALKKYDVVIIGVRAYNVSKTLAEKQAILMDYVHDGGLLITQYSTNWDSYADQLGPYPFTIGRGRVTDENSPVDFLLPEHPVLHHPNRISKQDFIGWVQERGIYFATNFAPEYKAPLAFTDAEEAPQNGSLIIADYGAGAFIYTGIAFFRELPAGVPGAYRLFINLIDYKKMH